MKGLKPCPYNVGTNQERADAMAKGVLTVTVAVVTCALLLVFGIYILYQTIPVHLTQEIRLSPPAGSFPMEVEGTHLTVTQLSGYTGPFWENDKGMVVKNAAAILVENTGDLLAAEGAVILQWAGTTMVFELEGIPPGAQVLILEKDAQTYAAGMPSACYGWCREEYPEDMGHVVVSAVTQGGMEVTNRTAATIPAVDIWYKGYDPEGDIYLGGYSRSYRVEQLRPGESRWIHPPGFYGNSGKVIGISIWVK